MSARCSKLKPAPQQLIDALGAHVMPQLARCSPQELLQWTRLLLTDVAREVGVCESAAFALTCADPVILLDRTARCLALLLPNVDRVRAVLNTVWSALQEASYSGPPPDVTMTPARPEQTSPDPVTPQRPTQRSEQQGVSAEMLRDIFLEISRSLSAPRSAEDPTTTQLLRRTLAASTKTFRSHSATEEDGFAAEDLKSMAAMPQYSFARDHPSAPELLQAIRSASATFSRLAAATDNLPAVLAGIAQDLRLARRTFTPREALALDTAVATLRSLYEIGPATLGQSRFTALCQLPATVVAEYSVLARSPRIFDQLFLARIAPAPQPADAMQLRNLPDIPIGKARADDTDGRRERRGKSQQQETRAKPVSKN